MNTNSTGKKRRIHSHIAIITRMAEKGNRFMNKVFICSPYRGDKEKNLENAITYCKVAYIYDNIPIAPHVFFTRIFPDDDSWRDRYTGMKWGKELMRHCKEIWIFCNELTEGMIEEIEEAKKLGLKMKFYNTKREEITDANYLIHTEIGPAYRRLIAESYGDFFYLAGGYADCSTCKGTGTGEGTEDRAGISGKEDSRREETRRKGFFERLFK